MNIRHTIPLVTMIFLFTASINPSLAATATSSPTVKPTTQSNLEDLKERLATKVAELRDVVTRALSGTITSVSISSAMLETTTKNYKIEFEDEMKVAQIINGKRTSLTIEDLGKNDRVTVFGSYDTTLELLKAKFIFIESNKVLTRIIGTIMDIDREGFAITVRTSDGKTITADIEKTTKAFSWTPVDGIVKSGFSKMAIGDSVHLIATPDPKNDSNISALRILDLGNLSGNVTPTVTLAPLPASPSQGGPTSTESAAPKTTPKPTVILKPTATPIP